MDNELLKLMRREIKKGNLEAVQKLVSQNDGLIDVVTPLGSWLHAAAECGNCDMIDYFMKAGLDVNLDGGLADANPLESAACNGHLEAVKLLYQNGAEMETKEAKQNPLFSAIYGDHYEVVKFLVENGIDITIKYPIGKLDQCDAYEYARQYGRTQIADYLKEKTHIEFTGRFSRKEKKR